MFFLVVKSPVILYLQAKSPVSFLFTGEKGLGDFYLQGGFFIIFPPFSFFYFATI